MIFEQAASVMLAVSACLNFSWAVQLSNELKVLDGLG